MSKKNLEMYKLITETAVQFKSMAKPFKTITSLLVATKSSLME